MYSWGDDRRFNSYSRYFKEKFGGRLQKITVNAGFTCPNRDGTVGTGGCTFCRNDAFTPSYCMQGLPVIEQIREGMRFHRNRYSKAVGYLVYFQSFSNTYDDLEKLREIYGPVLEIPEVKGIIIGTRPDCIDRHKLEYLTGLARDHYVAVEYGIESCFDETLKAINRGHDFKCAVDAVKMTREFGLNVGAHFILGLPGESDSMLVGQTELINELKLDTVKFHQLQIFRGTAMADDYTINRERYNIRSLEQYFDLFINILERLRPEMVVERFAGEAPPEYLLESSWGLIRNETLISMLDKHLEERNTWQGRLLQK